MRIRSSAALVMACAMLAACGQGEEGGLSAEEGRELNEAADMLDTSPDSLTASEDTTLGNGDAPAETGDLPVTSDAATGAGGNAAGNSQ